MKKLLMILAVSMLLVGCGNNTITTDDEAVSVSGKVSTATAVEVAKVEETATEYVAMEGYIEENTTAFACYDITIADENGNPVQPEGSAEVKIKVPDEFASANGSVTVLYVNGENMTRLDCSEANGYVTFKTNHFSIYVVAKYEDGSAIEELAVGTETVIPHVHKYKADEATAVAPTCIETGKEADEICSCGDKIVGAEIASTGHNYEEVADSAVEPTCDTDGKKADTKCSVCGEVVNGEVISANGHQYGDYVYNDDATTKKDGTETAICSVCGGKDTRTKAGTKIAVSYDGYDEFGNGYVWGDDGYKHFDASCPYPIGEVTDGGDWLSVYGIRGQEGQSMKCIRILQERYPGKSFPNSHMEKTYLGYYNGQLVYLEKWHANPIR